MSLEWILLWLLRVFLVSLTLRLGLLQASLLKTQLPLRVLAAMEIQATHTDIVSEVPLVLFSASNCNMNYLVSNLSTSLLLMAAFVIQTDSAGLWSLSLPLFLFPRFSKIFTC